LTQHRAILCCDILLDVAQHNRITLLDKHSDQLVEDRVWSRMKSMCEFIQDLHNNVKKKSRIEQRVVPLILRMKKTFQEKKTSHDWMINACLERYMFHPYTALEMFQKSISLSPSNYEVYMYLSNLLNSDEFERSLDAIKCLHTAVSICDALISIEYDPFSLRRIQANRLVFLGRILSHRSKVSLDAQINQFLATGLHQNDPPINPSNLELIMYQTALLVDRHAFHASFYIGFFYGFSSSLQSVTVGLGAGTGAPDREEALATSIVHFTKTLSLLDENKKVIFQSIIYNNIAAMRIQLHEYDEALKWYSETLKSNSMMGWAIRDKSLCLRLQNKFKEALDNFTFCIETLVPENPKTKAELMVTKAFWEVSENNLTVSSRSTLIASLSTALAIDPASCFGWYLKSVLLWSYDEKAAIECLTKGISHAQGNNTLGIMQLLDKRADFYRAARNVDANLLKEYQKQAKRFVDVHMRVA